MALVAVWYALAAAGTYAIARRRSLLAVPVVAGYLLAAGGAGLYLAYSTFADRVVDETVVTGPASAAGTFTSGAHETSGRAAVVGRMLTLTGFETDAGPDLRVRLVPGRNDDGGAGIDLGALKGNKGDQQYALPAGAPTEDVTVVIYCRAFSVNFGSAYLPRGRTDSRSASRSPTR
jgi:hypothetical protein